MESNNTRAAGGEDTKIRKRGAFSSSSSSIVTKSRIKRDISVGLKSPLLAMPPTTHSPVSARQLGATLWDATHIPSPKGKTYSSSSSSSPHLPDLSSTLNSDVVVNRSRGHADFESLQNASSTEINNGIKTRLKDISNALATSKELLKLVNRIWGLQEHNSAGISLLAALRAQTCLARNQVDLLIREQRFYRNEVQNLVHHFAQEKAEWKKNERARIQSSIMSIAAQLQAEKKLRLQAERLNKKLGKELADTKTSLSKVVKEKYLQEQLCNDLARGIGENRDEVEMMKRESAKGWDEIEKEREMLHLADVLREERVQMKLADAKYHFEEQNAAVDKLKSKLKAHLRTKIGEENDDRSPDFERIKQLEAYLEKIQFGSYQNVEKEDDDVLIANGEDNSADSDFHSIELNMEHNSKSHIWDYTRSNGETRDDQKMISLHKQTKGRKSCVKENAKNGEISSHCIDWDLITKTQENSNGYYGHQKLPEMVHNYKNEIKRYTTVKSLRDHILSASAQDFATASQHWSQPTPTMVETGSAVSESSPVVQVGIKTEHWI